MTAAVPRGAPDSDPTHVVLVEDDRGLRAALERVLAAAGFTAEGFASAEELLGGGVPVRARCFVIDVHLPGLSGFTLCARLMASGCEAPVIFMTAHDEPSVRDRAESLGAAAYLSKPFPGRNLVASVAEALRRRVH